VQSLCPDSDIRLEHGPGVCKSRNVWSGFNAATGDILMILDADLTTIPEELPYFMDVIASGQAEFVNGLARIVRRSAWDFILEFLGMAPVRAASSGRSARVLTRLPLSKQINCD
jgi:hypothetical protein